MRFYLALLWVMTSLAGCNRAGKAALARCDALATSEDHDAAIAACDEAAAPVGLVVVCAATAVLATSAATARMERLCNVVMEAPAMGKGTGIVPLAGVPQHPCHARSP